jgi:hypothetical protein
MPNFQPSSVINFTGNIAGSPAATVSGNAYNAFTGTVQYRTDTAPSGSTVFGTISPSYTPDGNVVVNVPYTHSPGSLKSDFILVYYKEGGGTVVASDPAVSTNPATGNLNFTLKPSITYSFGVQNVRRTESGLVGSSITSSSNVALSAGNYTGSIKGISASAVVTGGDVGGNLIVRSEDLTTGWGLFNLAASPGLLYLDNATTFWKLSESTTTYGLHDAYSSKFSVSPGEAITVSAYVAAAERDIVDIGALYSPWSNPVASRYPQMKFNLTTGAALQSIASPVRDAGITEVGTLPSGQKVYRIYMTTVPANFTTTNGGGLYLRLCQSDASPQYSGIVGNGAYFTRLQASKNLLANYIKTTTTPIESTAKTTDAFNETIKYRQDVSPSSDPTGLAVTQTATPDGNVVYKLSYSYSPGSIPADLLIAYVREGGGTISPSVTAFSTNAVSGDMSFVLKPNTNYRFGAQAARRTERGLLGGNIISTADISPTATSNFTGSIAGSPAATVVVNANTAFSGTAKYRTAGAPTNLVSPTGIATSPNSNATKTLKLGWAPYEQGANQADVIGLFYRRDNLVPTYTDSCVIMNVNVNTPAYYELQGVNPADLYSFGIAAGRRTENGIEWGQINTTYGSGTFSLYGPDVSSVYNVPFVGGTISPWTEFTPNGETTVRVSDVSTTIIGGSIISITSPTISSSERWMAEGWVKKPTGGSLIRRVFRLYGSNQSYGEILFDANGAIFGAGVGYAEHSVETVNVGGIDWYRMYIAANISPGITTLISAIYPSVLSPGNPAWSPEFTGEVITGPVSIRKRVTTSTGFDWTAITASTVNFTGNLDGSPASQIRSGTLNYRTTGAPTNVPIPASIAVSPSANATRTIKLSWEKYTQGAKQADVIGIFYRKDGVIPTLLDSCIITNVNTTETAYYEIDGLLPDSRYSFGIAAGRRTENGTEFGIINTVYGTSPYYVFDNDVIQQPDLRNIGYSVIPSPTPFYTPDQVLAYTIYDTNNTQFQNINYTTARQTTASPSTWFAEAYIKKQATATSPYFGMMRVDGLKATGSPLLGYNEIRFRYDDADFQQGAITSDGVSPGFAYKEEITTADGSVWYRVGVATNFPSTLVSPRVFLYPALGTTTGPGNYTYDLASTGTAVVADLTLRKAIKTVNFDWTNISPASVNFTGNLDGSPATKIRTQTANYRQDVSPTNDPTISPNTQSATADGNVVARISYSYSQGAIPADFILVYVKENGGTISPSVQSYTTNPVSGDMSLVLKPSTTYRFGVQAVRRTETGIKGGNIISTANIGLTSPNYTGLIAGVPSNTVTTVVSNYNSANDRNNTSPTIPTLANTIADYAPIILNSDGTCDIEFNWSYTNGSPQAANNVDGFIAYVQSFNYPNNYTFTGAETASIVPVANTSSYGYTFKNLPAHQWHNMAVRAYRVVDASPGILYSNFATSTYNNSRGITSTAQFPIGQKSHTVSSSPLWDNLFSTDNVTDATWSKQNITATLSSTELAPDGRTFAYELFETAGSPNHQLFRPLTPVQGKYLVFKFFVKRKNANKGVSVRYGAAGFGAIRSWQFEISPLSMTFPTGGAGHGAIRPLQNNWYEIFTAYQAASPNSSNIQLLISSNGAVAYEGTPTEGLYVSNLAAYYADSINGVSPGLPSTMDVVGSTWYDTPNRSLKIWNGSSWVENSTVGAIFGTSPSNLTGLSGDGANRIPSRYSGGFVTAEADAETANKNLNPIWLSSPSKSTGVQFFSVGSTASPDNDAGPATGYYGSRAIKVKFNGNTTGREVYFASSPAAYNIELNPNSKWIISGKGWLSSPSTVPFTAQLGILTPTSPTTGYRASSTISTRRTWTDLSGILNLTNDSSTTGTLVVSATGGGGTGGSPSLWLDGLMLERKVGPGSTPSKWDKGSQYGLLRTSKGAPLVAPSNIGQGTFLNGMTMNQGDGNSRPLLGGFYVSSARDGDNVIFPTPYYSIPSVVFFPGAQTTGSPFSNTTNVSTICEAKNLTTTGFTARIRFIGLAGSTSPVTDTVSFGASPSVLSPGSPDSAGYVGAPSPSLSINKSNGAEAFDDKYKYTFRVSINNIFNGEGYEPGNMDVALYARKAAGWYLVSTQNIRGGTTIVTTKTVSPTVTIDGVIYSPASGQAEFSIINLTPSTGSLVSFDSVSYTVANTSTDVTATATGSYAVPFAVIATSGSS